MLKLELDKARTLLLIKAIAAVTQRDLVDDLGELSDELETYLIEGSDEKEENDEEEPADETENEEPADEADEGDDEAENEGEEAPPEDDGDEALDAGYVIRPQELDELKTIKATWDDAGRAAVGALEFIDRGDDCDMVFYHLDADEEHLITGVTHVKRIGTRELHVRLANGAWNVFAVSRFPKDWSDALPVNELVEVTQDVEEA
jgi:cobalamin biosynthesis protein CobT